MSKKGGSRHFVRMRAAKELGVIERKRVKWLLSSAPGPHKKGESISAGVLLRDVLGRAQSMREAKKILASGNLVVDGKRISDIAFPIGLMDIVSEPADKKAYRMSLDGARLSPMEIKGEKAGRKYLKVTGKHTVALGKTCVTFHDGRNLLADKHIMTGDTCVLTVPGNKLLAHIKLAPGASCIVVKGKHRGETAKLEKLIERSGSHDTEAVLSGPSGEFVTVAKYLFAIDADY